MDSVSKHFIRTIRGGVEIKVCNVDSHRRPALAFKALTEVCSSEDAKRHRHPCIIEPLNSGKDSADESDEKKSGIQLFSMAYRRLREDEPRTDDFIRCSKKVFVCDLDDDTTLKQLKEWSKVKKIKLSSVGLHLVQADEVEKKSADECDLDQPLIRLKSKLLKNSKAKRKCIEGNHARSSTTMFAVKSEHNLVSEDSLLVTDETAPAINVKVEAPEAEQLGCQSTSFADHLSIDDNIRSSSCGVAPSKVLNMDHCENRELQLLAGECQNCLTNEISYDHLEDIESTSPLDGCSVKVENLDLSCPEFVVLPPSSCEMGNEVGKGLSCRSSHSEYRNSDVLCHSSIEEISYANNSSGIRVSDMAFDENVGCMGLNGEVNINLTKDKDVSRFPEKGDFNLTTQESRPKDEAYGDSHDHAAPERHQQPERLLSTRKAISPSTQEKLRLAMEAMELCNDVKKCSPEKFSGRKVVISPRQIIQKSKNAQGSPENSHGSRSIPNLTTGCASIRNCSESAIVFSRRQMHDIESLAGKLMSELKSMKDIVERKLLFEAHHSSSLKNDAAEVKSAIDNATKMEEAARKWLNMMSRDCNRFCKIMKLAPDNNVTDTYAAPREGKRIKFADEAGGELCHVKFFGSTPSSPS